MEPKIIGNRYVLAVKNLKESAAFYKNKLGFGQHGKVVDGIS